MLYLYSAFYDEYKKAKNWMGELVYNHPENPFEYKSEKISAKYYKFYLPDKK